MSLLHARSEVLLHRLAVVATLRPHEKISVTPTGDINKMEPSVGTALARTFAGDSRARTLDAVGGIIAEMAAIVRTEACRARDGHVELAPVLSRWAAHLASAGNGLAQLEVTYEGDASTVSAIRALRATVDDAVEQASLRRDDEVAGAKEARGAPEVER